MADNLVHELFMERCLQLAALGLGKTAPNPMVGAVIVSEGKIIGEGYHQFYGGQHAEVNAIKQVKDLEKLKNATLYVSLEPCCHYGKTPPCVNLILEHQISHVVIAQSDPNPLVSGKGIEQLKAAGVRVTENILADKAQFLNRRFNVFFKKKRPYIILKWAQSADRYIAKNRNEPTPISGKSTQILVHKWRSEEASILVGVNTVLADNPNLNNRFFFSNQQALRIVIDKNLRTPLTANVLDSKMPTLILNQKKEEKNSLIHYAKSDFENPIADLMQILLQKQVQSLIVEGGAITLQYFIHQNMWDEARIITNQKLLFQGVKAPNVAGKELGKIYLETDEICVLQNEDSSSPCFDIYP